MRVMLIDNNPDDIILTTRELKKEFDDVEVLEILDEKEFLNALEEEFDVVITDYQLKWGTGIDILKKIREKHPFWPVIMFTETSNEEVAIKAMKAGLDDYVLKSPKHFIRLSVAVKVAIEKKKKEKELEIYRRELEKSEKKYSELWNNANDMLYLLTPDGTFIDANKLTLNTFGYTKESLGKLSFKDIIADEHLEKALNDLQEIVSSGKEISQEYLCKTRDGKQIWVEIRSHPIFENGKIVAIQGIARDVTDRKRFEEELIKKERKYRDLFENSLDLIVITNLRGEFIEVNKTFEKVLGYSKEEIIGKNYREFLPEECANEIFKEYNRAFRSGKNIYGIELEVFAKDGKKIVLEGNVRMIKENGKIVAFHGNFRDITPRKRLENELKDSEEKFRKIFELSPSHIAILDENGVFLELNPAMKSSIKLDAVGKSLYEIFPRDVAKKRMDYLKKMFETNEIIIFEDSRNGEYFRNFLVPLELKGKRYCLLISKDLTELIRLNKLLKTIDRINDLLVKEKDITLLLRRACEYLSTLEEYYSVWVGTLEKNIVKTIAYDGEKTPHPGEFDVQGCMLKALQKDGFIVQNIKDREENCPFYDGDAFSCIVFPMKVDDTTKGFITIHSKILPNGEEIELLSTLANDLAFAIKAFELEEAKKRAFRQIEDNIEKFAILVDQIRNPLSVISGTAEMKVKNKEIAELILKQVEAINDLVKRLDDGWLESEKVREFLKQFFR
ncbi:PAS domain S-box [Archaeoglobus sulfaticallidus PM70-1]|uniref:histidine kinase n=1 Tax=Archaeoglobus sulfaticallidus PM70-1 TaxID=387631 RepID=N0BCM6_9EURY|nr:PAS domain S-box protein [Archaeoglobus sulfaticallidus]AGK60763.1 PAS domain S-box [Archaeoglobus sulfaticallidus PM70-1]